MVGAPSVFRGFPTLAECVSDGRLWACLMAMTGQTSWPPPGTELAACGQFFMAANSHGPRRTTEGLRARCPGPGERLSDRATGCGLGKEKRRSGE